MVNKDQWYAAGKRMDFKQNFLSPCLRPFLLTLLGYFLFIGTGTAQKSEVTIQDKKVRIQPVNKNDSVIYIDGFNRNDPHYQKLLGIAQSLSDTLVVRAISSDQGIKDENVLRSEQMILLEGSPKEASELIRKYLARQRPVLKESYDSREVKAISRQPASQLDKSMRPDSVILLDNDFGPLLEKSVERTSRKINAEGIRSESVNALPAKADKTEQNDTVQFIERTFPTMEMQMNDEVSHSIESTLDLAPVAIPDVYTIKYGEILVVDAPGHLANDYDLNGDPISWVSFMIPDNGTISGANTDGSFTYTPDPGFTGIDTFTISITDGNGNFANGQIAILVEDNSSPLAVPDVYTTPQDQPLVVTAPGHLANDSDPEGDLLSWVSFGIPSNGSISGASTDGTFTYTPDPGFSGLESFEITITDGKGNFADGQITILVLENLAPVAVPDVFTTNEDQPLTVSAPGHLANDNDPEGDPISWVSFQIPTNGSISGASTDGGFTYTPDPGFFGQESIGISIIDDHGNITMGEIIITVFPSTQRPPVAIADVFTTNEDQALTVPAPGHLANDYDPDGDPISWIAFQVPANGTVSGASTDGTFTYTPNPGFSGQDTFTVTIIDDNGNVAEGQIIISVIPLVGSDPVAIGDVFTTNEDEALIVPAPGHLANDYDPEGDPISWVSFQIPSNGTVSGASTNGGFTYTPDPGFSGQDSFEITITDGQGNFVNGQIIISVIPSDELPPVAVADVFTTDMGQPLVVPAPGHLSNDFDPDGDPLSWLSFQIPPNGTVSGASTDGGFTYTPDPGFAGIESFEISITDGKGNISSGRISILVRDNPAPVSIPDVYVTTQNEPLVVTPPGHLSNDFDLDGDPLSWVSFQIPSNGTVSGANTDGGFTYTPDPGFSGLDSFGINITDGNGNITEGQITILVIENLAPVAVPDVYTTDEGQLISVPAPGHLANDYDPDGDPISWVSFQIPSNGSVSSASTDGGFTFTPDPGFKGVESVVVTITDGMGNMTNGLLMFAVTPNYPPQADAGQDQVVVAGQSVDLDGSGSSDPEGGALSYSWMFDTPDTSDPIPAGSGALLTGSTTSTPSFTTDLPGQYSIKLIVNDGLTDSAPDYVVITALSIIQALENLESDVNSLETANVLNKGQSKALSQKLIQAIRLYDKGKIAETVEVLKDFRQQVLDLWKQDGVLTDEQAQDLIDQVDVILSVLPDSSLASQANMSDMEGERIIGEGFALSRVYPNPLKETASVMYQLPVSSTIQISVFDLYGREVLELVNGRFEAGNHEVLLAFDGLNSGPYILRISSDTGFSDNVRIIVAR